MSIPLNEETTMSGGAGNRTSTTFGSDPHWRAIARLKRVGANATQIDSEKNLRAIVREILPMIKEGVDALSDTEVFSAANQP